MGYKILIYGLLYFSLTTNNPSLDTWNFINEKTWYSNTGFAGERIVFYMTEKEIKKVIRQIDGSGVYTVETEFYNVILKTDTLLLKKINDLNDDVWSDDYDFKLIYKQR